MILSFFDPLCNPLSFFDPLRDPLKDCAVVPQKYVETLKKQGWVRPIKCDECMYCYYADNRVPDERSLVCERTGCNVTPDWFCAAGTPDIPCCGPDYCEIGGGDDADG